MVITFLNINKSGWVYQPQFVRLRHPYRGVRISAKVNQETYQTRYDIAVINKKNTTHKTDIVATSDAIVNGTQISDITVSHNGVVTPVAFELDGFLDLIKRADILDKRIALLEKG